MSDTDSIEVRPWVKRGCMLVNTSALDIDDPDHVYNQIVAMGKEPEEYGINHPYTEEFEGRTRASLIAEIIQLRKDLVGWAKADAMGVINQYQSRKF